MTTTEITSNIDRYDFFLTTNKLSVKIRFELMQLGDAPEFYKPNTELFISALNNIAELKSMFEKNKNTDPEIVVRLDEVLDKVIAKMYQDAERDIMTIFYDLRN